MNFQTHEQAMACVSCGLAGFTPEANFPQTPGLWEQPCPKCGALTVWVTEPRKRSVKAHLIITAGPAREHESIAGLCGTLLPNSRFAFVWDTAVMGASWRESLNAINTCRKCLEKADEWPAGEEGYVYALVSANPNKLEAQLEESA